MNLVRQLWFHCSISVLGSPWLTEESNDPVNHGRPSSIKYFWHFTTMFHYTLTFITKNSQVYNLCRGNLPTETSKTAHMRYICAPNPRKTS